MALITTEMLFDNNLKQIVSKIETDYGSLIMLDFDQHPDKFPDLFTWLELHPEIVGRYFMAHIIEMGFINEDIN